MNENDIRTAFGDTPAAFRDQVERTLIELEDMPMKKRYKISTMLIAAALIVTLLAGAAAAATQWKSFDFLQIAPLEGADDLIHTNLGSAEDDYIRLDIEEAVFDGEGLIVQFRITPKQTEKYNLTANDCSLTFNEDNPYMFVGITAEFNNSILGEDGLDSWVFEPKDNSIVAYASHFGPPIDDSVHMNVQLTHQLLGANGHDQTLSLSADLAHNADIRHYGIVNEEAEQPYIGLEYQGFELIEGSFAYTDAFGHYELTLHCTHEPAEIFAGSDSCFELLRHTNETLAMHRSIRSQRYLEEEGAWLYYEKGIMQPFVPFLGDGVSTPVAEGAILSMRSEAFDIFESIPVRLIPFD